MEQYVVSARKYRPETFETVVGQEHVTRTLLNEIRNNHLAQAFLFNGPRGVGKTTCARILAKEINRDSIEDQQYDFSYNIFELDAASNNGVEDIRLLTEQVRIPPQVGKYKVYIIDEVHMLSSAAFNAFLKTLEEPPPYAIFILATTERHKILPTVLSRCQIFNFNRISVPDIVAHLKGIAEKEGIEAEGEALHIIAQKADGALRDALTIFDQMSSVGEAKITYAEVIENLSVLDYDYYFELTEAFIQQDIARAMVLFDQILNKGFDGQIFLNGLAGHFRDLMVVRDEKSAALLDVPPHLVSKYVETSKVLSQGFLVNAINLANQYDLNFKASRNQRLHVELALIKICYLQVLIRPSEKKKPDPVIAEPVAKKNPVVSSPEPPKTEDPIKKYPTAPVSSAQPSVNEDAPQPKATVNIREVKIARLGDLDAITLGEQVKAPETKILVENEVEMPEPAGEPDSEMVDRALKKFEARLADQKQSRLQSIFKFIHAELEGTSVIIQLNKQHRVQMDDIKVELQQFLRTELGNKALNLEWKEIKKKATGSRAYTSQEKFEAMAKKNPLLNDLKQALNLSID